MESPSLYTTCVYEYNEWVSNTDINLIPNSSSHTF